MSHLQLYRTILSHNFITWQNRRVQLRMLHTATNNISKHGFCARFYDPLSQTECTNCEIVFRALKHYSLFFIALEFNKIELFTKTSPAESLQQSHGYLWTVIKMLLTSVPACDSSWTRTKLKSCGSNRQRHYEDSRGSDKNVVIGNANVQPVDSVARNLGVRLLDMHVHVTKNSTSMFLSATTSPTGLPPTWSWLDRQLGCCVGVHAAWLRQLAACWTTLLVSRTISARYQCCSQAYQRSATLWPCHSSGDRFALVTGRSMCPV